MFSLLGLARRAGACVSGFTAVEKCLRAKKARAVLADASLSADSMKKLKKLCEGAGQELLLTHPPGELARRIGKDGAMTACVTQETFALRIKELYTISADNTEV